MRKRSKGSSRLVELVGILMVLVVILSTCGMSSDVAGHAGSAQVQMSDHDFHSSPPMKTLIPEVSYHFIGKNTGRTTHEWMVSQNHSPLTVSLSSYGPGTPINCIAYACSVFNLCLA
jgi:hypothetical protein